MSPSSNPDESDDPIGLFGQNLIYGKGKQSKVFLSYDPLCVTKDRLAVDVSGVGGSKQVIKIQIFNIL
jgi:hypothetical protein